MASTDAHIDSMEHDTTQDEERSERSAHSSARASREHSPARETQASEAARTTTKTVISNLTPNVTAAHLREIAGIWGTVVDLIWADDDKSPSAVVEFSKRTEAQDAVDHMHRMTLDHAEIMCSFTVDSDPKTAVPLSAFGKVSHKETKEASKARKESHNAERDGEGRRGRRGGGFGRERSNGDGRRGGFDRPSSPRRDDRWSDRRGGFDDRRGGFGDRRGGFDDRRGGFDDRRGGGWRDFSGPRHYDNEPRHAPPPSSFGSGGDHHRYPEDRDGGWKNGGDRRRGYGGGYGGGGGGGYGGGSGYSGGGGFGNRRERTPSPSRRSGRYGSPEPKRFSPYPRTEGAER